MARLPRYVFRRANGSFRYKRNVPLKLRKYIQKKTLYRQLGESYEEAMVNLPRVHREIEQIFQLERLATPSERAAELIRANLGDVWLRAAETGHVGQEEDCLPIDEYADLAEDLEGSVPEEVLRHVRSGSIDKPPMTLERIFLLYAQDKAKGLKPEKRHELEQRIARLKKDVQACFGGSYWEYHALEEIRRRDAAALRDYLLERLAPNSVLRCFNMVKAAINHVVREEELDCRNPFASLKIEGSGASKTDRLPLSEEDMKKLPPAYEGSAVAKAIFLTLADTGARLAEIVGLEVGDVEVATQSLHIRPNSFRRLKTKNSTRHIPLSPRALACLQDFLANKTPTEAVFERYAGPRGNDRASAMLMKRLRQQVSDPKKTIHSLRHRMKDGLRNSNCPEALSLAILGHSQNTIADNYGAGYSLKVMREALAKVWG